jgi:branched-chain amino acid transport system permease protein
MVQIAINGVLQGLSFAVLGVAFGIVAATSRVFYIALGALYAASPYVFSALRDRGGQPWPLALIETIVVVATVSMLCEAWIHWPLNRSHSPEEVHFISSLGAFLIVVQAVAILWGNDPRFIEGSGVAFSLSSVRVTQGQAAGACASIVALALLFQWLRTSETGLTWRALADNADLLSVFGRDVRAIRRAVFAVSGALACIVSVSSAWDVGYDPQIGMRAVLVGLAATIIGGRGAFAWIALAGFVLGSVRAVVGWYLSSQWEDAATMVFMAAVLLALPRGLRALRDPHRRIEDMS